MATISIKSLTLEWTLERLIALKTLSLRLLLSASDSEEGNLTSTRTAIGKPSISRDPIPSQCQLLSDRITEWRLQVQVSTWIGNCLMGSSSYTTPEFTS